LLPRGSCKPVKVSNDSDIQIFIKRFETK
jgi:hypothetical protein